MRSRPGEDVTGYVIARIVETYRKRILYFLRPEPRRLTQFEDDNRQLKWLVADLGLDEHILQDVLSK